MKKVVGILVAIAMCVCFCLPAFAEDTGSSSPLDMLGGLDLSGFDLSGLTDFDLSSLTDSLSGLLGGATGGEGDGSSSGGISDILSGLTDFDASGVLSSFTEGLDLSSLTELFSGLFESLGSEGIDLSSFSFGDFDIGSLLGGGEGGDAAGMDNIMDSFSGVLEGLGLDSSVIEGLLDNDIVNFFANLYLGVIGPVEPDEPTTEAPSIEPEPTTQKHNPDMGVNDASAVIAACAALSVAAAAAFVCTRKKRA